MLQVIPHRYSSQLTFMLVDPSKVRLLVALLRCILGQWLSVFLIILKSAKDMIGKYARLLDAGLNMSFI